AIHRAEAGVAAGGWNFERVERARLGWIGQIRHVGVPHRFTGAEAANGDAVLDHVGDDVDLGTAFNESPAVLLDGGVIERAEAAEIGGADVRAKRRAGRNNLEGLGLSRAESRG